MALRRFVCPRHQDSTPSLVAYSATSAYCFACRVTIPLSEAGVEGTVEVPTLPPEDLTAKVAYIEALPKKLIRGFDLPYDSMGYYLVWPYGVYYKYRKFVDGEPKYIGPRGHKPPLLKYQAPYGTNTAIVVEGEFNAKSIVHVYDASMDVYCPGSAGNFYGKSSEGLLTALQRYRRIFIIADQDAAGAKAAIELKSRLLARGQAYTHIDLWAKDANDIMVQDGEEALQNRLKQTLGVPEGL